MRGSRENYGKGEGMRAVTLRLTKAEVEALKSIQGDKASLQDVIRSLIREVAR